MGDWGLRENQCFIPTLEEAIQDPKPFLTQLYQVPKGKSYRCGSTSAFRPQ